MIKNLESRKKKGGDGTPRAPSGPSGARVHRRYLLKSSGKIQAKTPQLRRLLRWSSIGAREGFYLLCSLLLEPPGIARAGFSHRESTLPDPLNY